MKKIFLILFFGIPFSTFAQRKEIDSLLSILQNSTDTQRVEILQSISLYYIENREFSKAHPVLEEEHALAEKLNYKKGLAACLGNYGNYFYYQGNYQLALEYNNKALQLRKETGTEKDIALIHQNIGIIYEAQSNYPKTLEYYLLSMKIYENLKDSLGMATGKMNIGMVYGEMGDFANEIKYLGEALEIFTKSNHLKGIGLCHNNLGNVFKDKKEYDTALEHHLLALKYFKEIGDKYYLAHGYLNTGEIYKYTGDYTKANEYYFNALGDFEKMNNPLGMAACYNNIGETFSMQKKYGNAIPWLEKSISVSKEIGFKELLLETYRIISETFFKTGDYKNAFIYSNLLAEVKDSIFNEQSNQQIAEMQTKYETEKKELQIENLNKDNAIKETEIKKQNFQKIAFASGFGLMLLLAFVIFRGYRQKQKANEIISAQKTEVEKQKELVDKKNKSLEVAYKHIEEKNTEILDSIRYAKRIQEAILPPQKLVKQHLEESFILYKPKDIVAGDFYWMHTMDAKVLFASVDCTGHGVPGAFVSILGYNGLNRCVKEFGLTQPAAILDKLCELVDEAFSKSEADIKDGMDIALCCYDYKNNTLEYSGAGNSLYHIREKNLTEYAANKQPVGKFAYRKSFINHNIDLKKNDSFYVFTDGYADQFGGPKGKKFKYSQFEKLLVSIQDKSMTEQKEILNNTIEKWKGELEQIDDICIIGVRI